MRLMVYGVKKDTTLARQNALKQEGQWPLGAHPGPRSILTLNDTVRAPVDNTRQLQVKATHQICLASLFYFRRRFCKFAFCTIQLLAPVTY